MASPLDGRLALVTGASGGIGGAVAVALALAGADLALSYSGHRDDAETVAATVSGLGRAAPSRRPTSLLPGRAGTWPSGSPRWPGPWTFVSSVAALNGGVVGPHYAASKAALHGLMHHLAPRVAGSGVTVNTIAPALIAGTRMLPPGDSAGNPPIPIPVGRFGQPGEIADMALAMLTNPYLTNKVITVDGGIYPT